MPFELKLDMARQCWDEARHCEISIKLSEWMGTEIGEFSESPFLYEAACNPDPVLRLTGVNRALEGLAIDVFNTMREFGDIAGDPVLEFCEDWMLADEVTHVKMGSDWLRRLTVNDKERQDRALEFQKVVDKLFSLGGFRGEEDDSPVRLARRFRELAGFDTDEMDELADISHEAREEVLAMQEAAVEAKQRRRRLVSGRVTIDPEKFTLVDFDAGAIAELIEGLLDAVGLDQPVRLEVDRDHAAGPRRGRRRSTRSCSRSSPARSKIRGSCGSSRPAAPPTCSAACCSVPATGSIPPSAIRPPTT